MTIPPDLSVIKAAAGELWRPIESAPKDGTRILVCGDRCDSAETFPHWRSSDEAEIAEYQSSGFRCDGFISHWRGANSETYDEFYWHRPSCWKPLPTPPVHASDCAVHNEPAIPNGPCDCGALMSPSTTEALIARVEAAERERDIAYEGQRRDARYRAQAEADAEAAEARVEKLEGALRGLLDVADVGALKFVADASAFDRLQTNIHQAREAHSNRKTR